MEYKIEIVNGEKKAKVGIYKLCNAEEIPAVIKHVSKMISYYSNIVNELIDDEERIDDSFLNNAIDAVIKFTEELKALNEAKKELEAEVSEVVCEKVGDWTVTLNKEAYEQDPHTIELKNHRYHLRWIYDNCYTIFDSEKKEMFDVKGEKRWENWKNKHKDEYCTDF